MVERVLERISVNVVKGLKGISAKHLFVRRSVVLMACACLQTCADAPTDSLELVANIHSHMMYNCNKV